MMMKTLVIAGAGLVLGACPVDRHEVGPTTHVLLSDFSGMVMETDVNPVFMLSGDPQYSIDMEVDVTDGTDDNNMMTTQFPSTSMAATTTVPGVTIPDSTFTPHDILDEIDYRRDTKLLIPATAMGSTLAIHAQAMDSRGLQSNVVDFTIALR